jgi:hypothetical protein
LSDDKLKEFLSKITDAKNELPYYLNILVKSGKKVLDYKIKKLPSKILKVTAHEEGGGWFVRSYHIPIDNLNISLDTKKKEVLRMLNDPRQIFDKDTKEVLDEITRKYEEILQGSGTGKFNFKTSRFKKKKDWKMGVQKKGF